MLRPLWILACLTTAFVVSGCAESKPEPQTASEDELRETERQSFELTYDHMRENALLADMSLSDYHFMPHRTRLTSLGEQRLCRLAELMREYGGELRFSSDETDPAILDGRLQTVKTYLAEAGLETTSAVVKRDLPGGRGMNASQCILVKVSEGTYKPKKSSGSSGAAVTPMGAGQGGGGGGAGSGGDTP